MSYIDIQSQSHRITKDLLSENKLFLSLNWLQCMFFFTYFAMYGMGQDLSLNLLSAKRSKRNISFCKKVHVLSLKIWLFTERYGINLVGFDVWHGVRYMQ